MKFMIFSKRSIAILTCLLLVLNVLPVYAAPQIQGVLLDKTSININVGDSEIIAAKINQDVNKNSIVTWNSSNPDVVSVGSAGTVTGLAPGSATITVTIQNGKYSASCLVEVTEVQKQEDIKKMLVKFKSGCPGLEEKVTKITLKSYLEKDNNKNDNQKKVPQIKGYKRLRESGNAYTVEMDEIAISDLLEDPDIDMIEEDSMITKLGDITPWNVEQIKAPFLHNKGSYGTGIKVAIFDTGIDLGNPDLQVTGGASFVEGITSYDDDNGHGTAMAGILAALQNEQGLLGVTPEVSLYSVKVLDQNGVGYYSNIINGIQWAIDNDIDIITMSFGGTQYSNILRDAIQEGVNNDILIIAASGNEGSSAINYPANYNEVVCVGAVDSQNNMAPFSNRGEEMDIVAPGVNVQTIGLNNSLITVSGTSAAVPHVAGIAAQLWNIKNEMTSEQIKGLLYISADRMGENRTSGWGLVNAEQAYILRDAQLNDFPINGIPATIPMEDVGGGGVVTASATVWVDGIQISDNSNIFKEAGEETTINIQFSNAHDRCDILINGQAGVYAPTYKYPTPKAQDYYIQNIAVNDTFTYKYVFNSEGIYTIRFHCTDDPDNTYDRYFHINVSDDPFDNAIPITEGTYQGSISTAGEEDYYKLTTSTAGFYTIRTQGTLDTRGYIYRNDRSEIYNIDDNINTNDDNFLISQRLDANTDYYIKVIASDGNDTGAYTLQVIKEDYSDYLMLFGYNWTIKNINTQIPAYIDYDCDYDVIGFYTQDAGEYIIRTNGSTDTYGYLYDNMYGIPIEQNDNGGEGSNFLIDRTLAANTLYFVVVKHASPSGTGYYELYIETDDHGNDLNSATALTVDVPEDGRINYAGDVDWFSFTTSDQADYLIESSGTTPLVGEVYYSDGQKFVDCYLGNDNINFYRQLGLAANTQYYIKVQHQNSSGTGDYGITVARIEDSSLVEKIYLMLTLGYVPNWCVSDLEPVNIITGNYYSIDKELSIPTRSEPLEFIRFYNSRSDYDGVMGKGWTHNYNSFLAFNEDSSITVTYGDGHSVNFTLDNEVYTPQAGAFENLTNNGDGTYTLLFKNQLQHVYDSAGKLVQIVDKNNNTTTLQYSGSLLASVTEPSGRALQYSYTDNKLTQVSDPAGRTLEFTYDASGNMATFENLNGEITTYGYDINGLTSVLDPLNHYIVRNTYDVQGRVITQLDSKGQISSISYDDTNRKNTVTDARNNNTYYYYDDKYRVTKIEYANSEYVEYTYDDDYNKTSQKDANGNTTTYTYDTMGNLLTQTDPTPLSYTTSFIYDSKNNPTSITDRDDNVTTNSYDINGNIINTTKTVSGQSLTQTFAYNQYGQLISITNANNKITEMTYDQYGNLETVTDPLDNETSFTYDIVGRLLTKTDAREAVWTYTYDNEGNVLTETDPLNNTITKTYDAVNNLLSIQNQRGYITTFTYDENDRQVQIVDPLNNITTITYDANGNKTSVTDGNNHTTYYSYDVRNRLIQVIDPDNYNESYTLDGNGNILSKTDKRDKTTTYEYDELNRLIRITDPLNGITEYQYDPLGNKISEKDPLNHTTSYTYDEISQLMTVTDPLNNLTQYTYDLAGNKVTMTDARNKTWSYTYDDANRLIGTTDPSNAYTQIQYDVVGNVTSQIDANNHTTQYTYDLNSRLLTETNPLNKQTSYTYDNAGNRLTMTNADNQTWSYEYDQLNRLTRTTDPLGKYTQNGYDALGNVTSKTDPKSNTTLYTYNGRGLIATVTDALNNITSYQYDGNGNLIMVTDAKNNIRTYEYDDLNRQITETVSGRIIAKTYDLAGNMITKTKADNSIITYAYDYNNRLTNISYPDSTSVIYQYNQIGLRTSMTDKEGISSYTYDDLGRLETVTRNSMTVTYNYDDVGNLTGITYPDNTQVTYAYNNADLLASATEGPNTLGITYDNVNRRIGETMPNTVAVTYQYDNSGRLTLLDHVLNGTSLAKSLYTLDDNGNRTSKTDENNAVTEYTYDYLNQLTQVNYPGGKNVEYTYDQVGNRTSIDGMVDSNDRLTQSIDGEKTINYTYDGDGNLIGKTITNGAITDTYEYFYDYSAGLPRLLVEKKNGTEVYNYIYAGRLYARKGSSGTVYYHQDGLGSTLAITDQSGNILNKYQYDVYGTPEVIQETVTNCILFTGEMYDDGSGLYYLRARYYNPTIGRFMTPDSYFGELDNPLSQNLYIYCQNNPVNFVDPSGHVRCGINVDTEAWKERFGQAWDYIYISGKQIILGNYTKDVTLAGTGGQVVLGVIGVDFPADIRDIFYDLQNWEWSWSHAEQTGLDMVALVPLIGGFKYTDEAATLMKGKINFPKSNKDMKNVFGIGDKTFHQQVKPEIIKQIKNDPVYGSEFKKMGNNPDIGIDGAGNVVIKDVKTGKTLETNWPFDSFLP